MKLKNIYFIFAFFISTVFAADEIKPYLVYLKPGTSLTRISDKKVFKIDKGIYVKALETDARRRDYFVVYNKEGKAVYETNSLGVVEVANDFQLLPNINAEISYPPPSTLRSNNKYAFFDTQFNYYLDQLNTTSLDKVYNQEMGTAYGNRYEIRTLYSSELPVNFGFTLNYQTAVWENDVDEIELSILSFGPHIQHYVYETDKMAISLHLGGEYSPIYKTTSGAIVEKYQGMMLDFGAEALWDTDFGKWSLGGHFRRHDVTLMSSTRPLVEQMPREIIINSIGVMVGYKYEWEL